MPITRSIQTYDKCNTNSSPHEWLEIAILERIKKFQIMRILDLGCGNGHLDKKLVEQGLTLVGCDPEETSIDMARKELPQCEFHVLGVYDDPEILGELNFDMVLACEVLEHLFLPRKLTHFSRKALKPNGLLLITTPYYGSYIKNILCSIFNKWDYQFTVLWDGGHIKFWSLNTLKLLLKESGFELIEYSLLNQYSPWLKFIWPNNIILIARKLDD